jgi:capsular polysaccharide biosynthesis protein
MMNSPSDASDSGPKRPWLDEDATDAVDRPSESAANLVSLGFFTTALRRSARFWCITAVVGLVVGSALYLKAPPTSQASATLLLSVGAESQPGQAILEDQALAQSHAMAGLTLRKLGLHESVNSFLASYVATPLTDRVLQITATAPSSDEAVSRANALATGYLTFRANQLQAEQQLQFTALDQQVSQARQQETSINQQISQLSAQPASPSQRARISALREQGNDLTDLEHAVSVEKASIRVTTATMIGGSKVLDLASPAPLHSRLKRLLLYAGGGFIIGLILGMGIIVVRALLSDRLRRRDDVSQALGTPVRSVLARRGRVSDRNLEHIVAYLRDAVPAGSRSVAALAVVPVDDPRVAAQSVTSLAVSCAQQGRQVVVADLCAGAPAARLLGAEAPGVRTVSVDGTRLVAAVPAPTEFAPIGPLRPTSPRTPPAIAGELAAACASADLLLTLIALDPSDGGEHLATWAANAVVVVTAGRSSWTKINAVGEMIRLTGTRLVSAVLVGADKIDESLGMTLAPDADRYAVTTPSIQADAQATLSGDSRGRLSDDTAMSGLQTDLPENLGQHRRTGR